MVLEVIVVVKGDAGQMRGSVESGKPGSAIHGSPLSPKLQKLKTVRVAINRATAFVILTINSLFFSIIGFARKTCSSASLHLFIE